MPPRGSRRILDTFRPQTNFRKVVREDEARKPWSATHSDYNPDLVGDQTILYSGAEEHHRGVGLILSRKSRKSSMEWNPVNDRIISACFLSSFAKLTRIQLYSPTNEANEADKDTFYEQLQREIAKMPKHDSTDGNG
ncbi:craniofacial development protein 2-like [Saccostrea cucullata]|uniref:craniofacial development protein 2-like n=1 Tax=Saccostrea cuccullata TaxID=36930 RepID=UPI002ED1477C